MKRALISVFDKNGVLDFANFLVKHGVEIISTGGTYKHLKENGVPVIEVAEVTGAPEMLDGRVKTLHPVIHGGILAIRDNAEHMATIKERGITPIDMVVVNLYPFFKKVNEDLTFEEKVEFIDIGGPTMLRSAAKSFKDVVVISDTADYETVMKEMEAGEVTFETRKRLAGKVLTTDTGAMKDFEQLNGKELSFNNLRDMDVAWRTVCEFTEPACCGLKHSTPCGAAIADNVYDAYVKAYECDPVSIFGGIVALNKTVDEATAKEMVKIFLEIVIAPDFTPEALEVLKTKKNLRVIKCHHTPQDKINMVKVDGGLLVQDEDLSFSTNYEAVTEKAPTAEEMENLIFGMKIVKHVKSNAIVVVKDKMAVGIGNGETNRIWPTQQAIERAGERIEGAILASDAFFPFRDVVDTCAKAGIKAIIQPGGSIRDKESIDACNEHGISMVFTGMRHFKH